MFINVIIVTQCIRTSSRYWTLAIYTVLPYMQFLSNKYFQMKKMDLNKELCALVYEFPRVTVKKDHKPYISGNRNMPSQSSEV